MGLSCIQYAMTLLDRFDVVKVYTDKDWTITRADEALINKAVKFFDAMRPRRAQDGVSPDGRSLLRETMPVTTDIVHSRCKE